MANQKITLRQVHRLSPDGALEELPDQISVEEPLEIRIEGRPLVVIMRTPGDDDALTLGFLLTEAIVPGPEAIDSIEKAPQGAEPGSENIIHVTLSDGAEYDHERSKRSFFASSSCGVCGKGSIEAITTEGAPVVAQWKIPSEVLRRAMERLGESQPVFDKTGSLHAAAVCDLEGKLICCAEDIGRHNAVDKVIGDAARKGLLPLSDAILLVSGRTSFEITQKAYMAGIALIAAVSGASSLAVELAEDQGLTLVGFLRGGSMTIYNGAWRIGAPASRPD